MQDWKEEMFNEYCVEFIKILRTLTLNEDILEFFKKVRSSSANRFAILDLGCGIGRLFPFLSQVGTLVVGIDYSECLVKEAMKLARSLPNVTVILQDMRSLRCIFPQGSFDLVIRAYTSLGYFRREVEADILKQCASLVYPRGLLILDTFNADWFRMHRTFKRCRTVDDFEFKEYYQWDDSNNKIVSDWIYEKSNHTTREIHFELDGYDLERVDSLLCDTGWKRERLFSDFSIKREITEISVVNPIERLIVLASC